MTTWEMLNDLRRRQQALDALIFKNHKTTRNQTWLARIMSFIIEIAELYNEERSFKYWSYQGASNKDVILAEFSDALHFLLSLSLDINFVFSEQDELGWKNTNYSSGLTLFTLFWRIIKAAQAFKTLKTKTAFQALFHQFWELTQLLGIENDEIKAAYLSKWQTNIKRQTNNY